MISPMAVSGEIEIMNVLEGGAMGRILWRRRGETGRGHISNLFMSIDDNGRIGFAFPAYQKTRRLAEFEGNREWKRLMREAESY